MLDKLYRMHFNKITVFLNLYYNFINVLPVQRNSPTIMFKLYKILNVTINKLHKNFDDNSFTVLLYAIHKLNYITLYIMKLLMNTRYIFESKSIVVEDIFLFFACTHIWIPGNEFSMPRVVYVFGARVRTQADAVAVLHSKRKHVHSYSFYSKHLTRTQYKIHFAILNLSHENNISSRAFYK